MNKHLSPEMQHVQDINSKIIVDNINQLKNPSSKLLRGTKMKTIKEKIFDSCIYLQDETVPDKKKIEHIPNHYYMLEKCIIQYGFDEYLKIIGEIHSRVRNERR